MCVSFRLTRLNVPWIKRYTFTFTYIFCCVLIEEPLVVGISNACYTLQDMSFLLAVFWRLKNEIVILLSRKQGVKILSFLRLRFDMPDITYVLFWAFRDTVLNVITPWSSVVSSSGPTGGRCIELLLLSMFSRSYVSLKSLQCRLLWSANRHSKQNTRSHLLFRWSSCYNKCLELAQDGSEMDEGPSTCFKKWKRLNFLRFSLSSQ